MTRQERINEAQAKFARLWDAAEAARLAYIAASSTREGWFGEEWDAWGRATDARNMAHREYSRAFN